MIASGLGDKVVRANIDDVWRHISAGMNGWGLRAIAITRTPGNVRAPRGWQLGRPPRGWQLGRPRGVEQPPPTTASFDSKTESATSEFEAARGGYVRHRRLPMKRNYAMGYALDWNPIASAVVDVARHVGRAIAAMVSSTDSDAHSTIVVFCESERDALAVVEEMEVAYGSLELMSDAGAWRLYTIRRSVALWTVTRCFDDVSGRGTLRFAPHTAHILHGARQGRSLVACCVVSRESIGMSWIQHLNRLGVDSNDSLIVRAGGGVASAVDAVHARNTGERLLV